MATLVPERLPSRASAGEKRAFEMLRHLPGDTLVYYEAVVTGRRPDFVIISPRLGVLVLEVKGWYAGNITRADPETVSVVRDGVSRDLQHPLGQARDYMWRTAQAFESSPLGSRLRQTQGRHQGKLLFPLAFGCALSNITRAQAVDRLGPNLDAIFPPHRTLFRDDLLQLAEETPGDVIEARLHRMFDPWWDFGGFTKLQVKAIRAILHPESIIAEPAPAEGQDPLELLKILDLKQEQRALEIGSGHRIVYGVAGSGKTVLLVARARFLAEQKPSLRLLLLCYNTCLAAKLGSLLARYPSVKVRTFHSLAAQYGIIPAEGESGESLGTRLLPVLRDRLPPAQHYDGVLIDEAQDFEPNWFTCAKHLLKDPEEGDLIIVADGNQGIYRAKPFTWTEVGIHAQGRSYHAKFDLDRNYRNTRPILRIAEQFLPEQAPSSTTGEQAIVAPLVASEEAHRDSTLIPRLLPCQSREEEISTILGIVRELLSGRWCGVSIPPLGPSEIAIVYPRLFKGDEVYRAQLQKDLLQLTAPAGVLWVTDPSHPENKKRVGGPELKIQTIHSSKGLEYPAVIVAFADRFAPDFIRNLEANTERRLAFVSATRAENYLAVTWTGRFPWLIKPPGSP